ncbi:MAG: hypothetical protein PHI55_10185 [Burkholderiaceae bacterium]|nr:hypothetical protein [Burkholderiaceae bacterium]
MSSAATFLATATQRTRHIELERPYALPHAASVQIRSDFAQHIAPEPGGTGPALRRQPPAGPQPPAPP